MTSSATRLVILAAAFAFVAGSCREVHAQAPAPSSQEIHRHWPLDTYEVAGGEVHLYTVGHPTRLHHCHSPVFAPESIRCANGGSKPKVYQMEEVQALVWPGVHKHHWLASTIFVALGGGIMTGAVCLASVAPLAVIGSIVLGIVAIDMLVMALLTASDAEGNSKEELIYLKPGKDLAIRLH